MDRVEIGQGMDVDDVTVAVMDSGSRGRPVADVEAFDVAEDMAYAVKVVKIAVVDGDNVVVAAAVAAAYDVGFDVALVVVVDVDYSTQIGP
jgi:hypothetical protein